MHSPVPSAHFSPARPVDIDLMDEIEQEAFNTPWSRDLMKGAILNKHYDVRVLWTPGMEMVGFYIAHVVESNSNLDNLVVEKRLRRSGYGRKLVQDWIRTTMERKLDTLTLQVNTDNKAAQNLYERFGFRTMRLMISYYPNGEDAYHMERPVDPKQAVRASRSQPEQPAPGTPLPESFLRNKHSLVKRRG